MNKRMVQSTWFLSALTLLAVSIAGCGRETINVADTTPPYVSSTVPALGAPGVAVGAPISATFSKLVNCPTASTFTVTGGGASVTPLSVNCTGSTVTTATFTPSTPLVPHTLYTATITGATDLAGNAMASPYAWNFEAVAGPSVVSTTPVTSTPGPTGVAFNQVISATFLQLPTTAPGYAGALLVCPTASTFTVAVSGTGGTFLTPTSVTCSGATATFNLGAPLAAGTSYTATLTTGVTDAAGIGLPSTNCSAPCAYRWTFTTNTLPPTVSTTNPANLAGSVPTSQALTATFSDGLNGSMKASTINATNFTLVNETTGVAVTGIVTYVGPGLIATFTPTSPTAPTTPTPLANNTSYEATITTGVQDSLGNALVNNYVWVFTTIAAPDTTQPTVIGENPVGGATGVPNNQVVSATFSKGMKAATITATSPATFTLTGPAPATTVVGGTVAYSSIANALTFTLPTGNTLAAGVYTATITTAATDLSNNALTATGGLPLSWSFTVGTAAAPAGPYITLTSPVDNATSVPLTQAVSATFSTAMKASSFSSLTFTLTSSTGAVISGTYGYNTSTQVATFTPSTTTPLLADTTYTADITNGVTDASTPGNALVSGSIPNPWIFTTAASSGSAPVALGTAGLFGDFGGSAGMTNDAGVETVINGDIGTTAVSQGVVNFHDTTVDTGGVYYCSYNETPIDTGGQVNGTIYTDPGTAQPTTACPLEGTAATAAIALQAWQDAETAYAALSPASMPNGTAVETCAAPQCTGTNGNADELGMRILRKGVYLSTPHDYQITTGPLTLDGNGDPTSTWVFQMPSSTLKVGSASGGFENVILTNGAQAANVFWYVGAAATFLPAGGTFYGTVISYAGVTTGTSGVTTITTINGRLISVNAAVTISNTVINVPAP